MDFLTNLQNITSDAEYCMDLTAILIYRCFENAAANGKTDVSTNLEVKTGLCKSNSNFTYIQKITSMLSNFGYTANSSWQGNKTPDIGVHKFNISWDTPKIQSVNDQNLAFSATKALQLSQQYDTYSKYHDKIKSIINRCGLCAVRSISTKDLISELNIDTLSWNVDVNKEIHYSLMFFLKSLKLRCSDYSDDFGYKISW